MRHAISWASTLPKSHSSTVSGLSEVSARFCPTQIVEGSMLMRTAPCDTLWETTLHVPPMLALSATPLSSTAACLSTVWLMEPPLEREGLRCASTRPLIGSECASPHPTHMRPASRPAGPLVLWTPAGHHQSLPQPMGLVMIRFYGPRRRCTATVKAISTSAPSPSPFTPTIVPAVTSRSRARHSSPSTAL